MNVDANEVRMTLAERMNLRRDVEDLNNLSGVFPSETFPIKRSRSSSNKLQRKRNNLLPQVDPAAVQMNRTQSHTETTTTWEKESSPVPISTGDRTKKSAYMSLNSLGSNTNSRSELPSIEKVATNLYNSSTFTNVTPRPSNDGSEQQLQPLETSLPKNGMQSSKEKPLTSTRSSVLSTTYTLLNLTSDTLDLLRSSLHAQNLRNVSRQVDNGLQRTVSSLKRQRSLSLTDDLNSKNTEGTCSDGSPRKLKKCTNDCLNSTKQSESELVEDSQFYSRTERNSSNSMSLLSPQEELKQKKQVETVEDRKVATEILRIPTGQPQRKSATDLTAPTDVEAPTTNANIAMSANSARKEDIVSWSAKSLRESELVGRKPRYLRYNIFDTNFDFSRGTAEWTETAKPLPQIPQAELDNPIVKATIETYPELFHVDTPINVEKFEELLKKHPNLPFKSTVITGLLEGNWTGAITLREGYPDTHDDALLPPSDPAHIDFLKKQCEKEVELGRFSKPFGPDLYGGMYSPPVHVVPKPNSPDFRLITNHSAGPFSLNSMIDHERIAGFPLDNMTHLSKMLQQTRAKFPNDELVVFKSDIAEAYRLIPVHKYWQIKQIVTIDGKRYVDRRNCFGNRASAAIFIAFSSLVNWIAKKERGIDVASYVDDFFGVELKSNLLRYEPYDTMFPASQTKLLQLWDELGIPHKRQKQVFGPKLTIIGIEVDANSLSFSLSADARGELENHLREVAREPKGKGVKYRVRDLQQVAGWLNWGLNVFPSLRPGLCNVYAKLATTSRNNPFTSLYINNAIRSDLTWAADHLASMSGIYILKSLDWELKDADMYAYCDASLTGMGIYFPKTNEGLFAPVPESAPKGRIFYFEALTVLSALHIAITDGERSGMKIVLYTDNFNTVEIFNSLAAQPDYNEILKAAVDIIIEHNVDLRVIHIPGSENVVADALSRNQLIEAVKLAPGIQLWSFQPPDLTTSVGASKK